MRFIDDGIYYVYCKEFSRVSIQNAKTRTNYINDYYALTKKYPLDKVPKGGFPANGYAVCYSNFGYENYEHSMGWYPLEIANQIIEELYETGKVDLRKYKEYELYERP